MPAAPSVPRCRPAAHSGTPLGQVTITGDVINDPRLADSEHGPAAIMPVRLAAIGVGGTAMASWLTVLCRSAVLCERHGIGPHVLETIQVEGGHLAAAGVA